MRTKAYILSAFGLLVAFLVLLPLSAKADTITLSSGNTTVSEGSSTTLLYEFSNTYGVPVYLLGDGAFAPSQVAGTDSSDKTNGSSYSKSPTGLSSGESACSSFGSTSPLGANDSCYFSLTILTPSDTGETDGDYATWALEYEVEVVELTGGTPLTAYPTFTTDVTVTDPPTGVPEPGTMALSFMGLLAIGLLARRCGARA